jgi:hypothetical protein
MTRFVVLAACGGAGFVLGRRQDVLADTRAPLSVSTAMLSGGEPPGTRPFSTCPDLGLVEAMITRAREDIEGVPVLFPADVAPGVSPEGFRAALDPLSDECPELVVDRVDCDEYPCVAWTRGPACPGTERFDSSRQYDVALVAADGTHVEWKAIYATQPDAPRMTGDQMRNFRSRIVTRQRAARDALAAEIDGRQATRLEIATHERDVALQELEQAVGEEAIESARKRLDRAERNVEHEEFLGSMP